MKSICVVPFTAQGDDGAAADLARWLTRQTAAGLSMLQAQLLLDEVSLDDLSAAARQLGMDAAIGASVSVAAGRAEIAAALGGEISAAFSESVPLGNALELPAMLARSILEALGEDASAAQGTYGAAPAEFVPRFCSAAVHLEDGDAAPMLELAQQFGESDAPVRALVEAAQAAAGGERMPALFSALELLVQARPHAPEALFAVAEYRALHLDAAGAREMYLRAREKTRDAALAARCSRRLADLAELAGRTDEAIAHLRAAVKLADDAQCYARLGELLLPRHSAEGVQALLRATVLAPDDASLRAAVSRALMSR